MNANEMIIQIYNKSITGSNLNENQKYNELANSYDNVLDELLDGMPNGKNNTWSRLENIILQKENINVKDSYIRGFKDGVRFILNIKD